MTDLLVNGARVSVRTPSVAVSSPKLPGTRVAVLPTSGPPGGSGLPGPPGPPGPTGTVEVDIPDLPDLTLIFENGLI